MIDHNVMRLHVSVHDALAVAKIKSLEQLQDVESHVKVVELGIQASEIGVVDILENERRCLTLQHAGGFPPPQSAHRNIHCSQSLLMTNLGVSHDIEQRNDVGTAGQVLQDLDLSLDLLLLDGLEDLDDAFLVVDNVDSLKHLGVFAPS